MKAAIATLAIASVLVVGRVDAQPGQTPPQEPTPYPEPLPPAPVLTPQPPPVPTPPPPPFQPRLQPGDPLPMQLDPDEVALLQHGEITDAQHYGGGLASSFVGFGLGQAIQGRWRERGWIFGIGESVGLLGVILGVFQPPPDGCAETDLSDHCTQISKLSDIGFFVMMGFHIWGAVDAFVVPGRHNRMLRELRTRLGMPLYTRMAPYVNTHAHTAGVVFRF